MLRANSYRTKVCHFKTATLNILLETSYVPVEVDVGTSSMKLFLNVSLIKYSKIKYNTLKYSNTWYIIAKHSKV